MLLGRASLPSLLLNATPPARLLPFLSLSCLLSHMALPACLPAWAHQSATDDPEGFLLSAGWDRPEVHVMGDEKTNYGVYPHKPAPRWAWNFMPRHWIMTATTTTTTDV